MRWFERRPKARGRRSEGRRPEGRRQKAEGGTASENRSPKRCRRSGCEVRNSDLGFHLESGIQILDRVVVFSYEFPFQSAFNLRVDFSKAAFVSVCSSSHCS